MKMWHCNSVEKGLYYDFIFSLLVEVYRVLYVALLLYYPVSSRNTFLLFKINQCVSAFLCAFAIPPPGIFNVLWVAALWLL